MRCCWFIFYKMLILHISTFFTRSFMNSDRIAKENETFFGLSQDDQPALSVEAGVDSVVVLGLGGEGIQLPPVFGVILRYGKAQHDVEKS